MVWLRGSWFLIVLASAAAASFVIFAWRGGAGKQEQSQLLLTMPAQDHFAVDEGGRLFARYCAPCHGEAGVGDGRFYASALEPAPADFTDPVFQHSHSDQRLRQAVIGGSASVGKSDLCPAWGKTFSSTEVDYLIASIKQLQRSEEGASVKTSP